MTDDPLTPAEHDLRPGDHLGRVGATYRFRSFGPIWNDPDNRELRRRRPNPHVMAVGEHVHVPELIYQECDRPTEQRHTFRAELHPLEVRLTLKRWDGKDLPDVPSDVKLDGQPAAATTSAGSLQVVVTPLNDRCVATVGKTELVTRIGFLEPADTVAGCRQRLYNLGYDPGDQDDPASPPLRSAVEEFQCDHGLTVDGRVGPDTRNRLMKEHGC